MQSTVYLPPLQPVTLVEPAGQSQGEVILPVARP